MTEDPPPPPPPPAAETGCRVCGFRLDPVLVDRVHPMCEEQPRRPAPPKRRRRR